MNEYKESGHTHSFQSVSAGSHTHTGWSGVHSHSYDVKKRKIPFVKEKVLFT